MSGGTFDRRSLLKFMAAGAGAAAIAPALGGAPFPAFAQAKKRKIIFVTHDLNIFFVPVIIGMRNFGDMAGWETQMQGVTPGDTAKTVELQYNAIAAKPDAVGFTAINLEAFVDPIKAAQDAGIFVVLFNTRAPGVKEATGCAYVGQDFIPAGNVAGYEICKYIAKHLPDRKDGKIIQPIIQPGHFALEARNLGGTQGVDRYNKEFGTTFTTEPLATTTVETEALAKFEAKWSAESDQIVGWLASDFTHGFVGHMAVEKGLVGKFAVGGYDLVDFVMEGIKNGSVDFSLGQNPYAQGFLTSALMYQGLEVGYPASDIDTGAELVDATNIDKIMAREAIWPTKAKEVGIG
jgi:ABC-type sugar transport system substrate-binding protein